MNAVDWHAWWTAVVAVAAIGWCLWAYAEELMGR